MSKLFRSTVIFLCLVTVLGWVLPFSVSATPQTHPNTHVNTGDQRADIIAVALTQVGYYEGPNNDTKYGVWYGYNNLGWCGIFVAWCANQAGVPTSVLARTGVPSPEAFGLTAEPSGYVPKPGDLFFSFNNSHVGLVYYVDGEYFYSLEGNTWENGPEGVYIRRHKQSNVKFASPKYRGGAEHNYIQGNETAHPHKEYYRCSRCGDQYYTGKTATKDDCVTCLQNSCTHQYGPLVQSGTQHSRTCSRCGKQETAAHSWNQGTVLQAATCSTAGTKLQTCPCGAEQRIVIPATGKHNYSSWKWVSDKVHSRKCSVCNKEESVGHNLQQTHQTDEDFHWYFCDDCQQQIGKEAHSFGPNCDSPCTVCQYVRPEGHRYSKELLTDEEAHWHECAVCGLTKDKAVHDFTADCDERCDTCGFERVTQHSFEPEYAADDTDHWFACSVCGQQKDVQPHTPEEVLRQGAIQHCTVCRKVLTSEFMHTHGYDTVYSNETHHWGICSCGLDMEQQPHQWSVRTDSCSVCGQFMPARQTDYSGLLPWVGGCLGILALGVVLLVLLLRKRK